MKKSVTILLLLKRVDCNDGVAAYLESIVDGLTKLGDRIVIVSGSVTALYGSEARRRRIEGAVLNWTILENLSDSVPRPAHVRSIIALINRYHVDIVSPQGFSRLPVGFIVARLSGLPIVTNFHLINSKTSKLSMKKQVAYRLVTSMFNSDKYIAMSTDIEDFFVGSCRIAKHRVHKQILGVDTDFYRRPSDVERQAARRRFGVDNSKLVAVMPARLNVSKGHDVVSAAFRLVRARNAGVGAICLFAGDGDERLLIEADALRDESDRSTFRFLGFVDPITLRDAYWAADIVLLPSRVEGFGLGVAEAMCCGAIVIRTRGGGWQDQVIEGSTGYAIPFDDPHALAAAIEKVLHSSDRSAMREEAMRVSSARFAKSLMVQGTSALYRDVAYRNALSVKGERDGVTD